MCRDLPESAGFVMLILDIFSRPQIDPGLGYGEQVVDVLLALAGARIRPHARGAELIRHVFRGPKSEGDALAGRRETTEVRHS